MISGISVSNTTQPSPFLFSTFTRSIVSFLMIFMQIWSNWKLAKIIWENFSEIKLIPDFHWVVILLNLIKTILFRNIIFLTLFLNAPSNLIHRYSITFSITLKTMQAYYNLDYNISHFWSISSEYFLYFNITRCPIL